MVEVRKLVEYSMAVRRSFLEKLGSLPWEKLEENREASFYSMKGVFLHMLEVEDRFISHVIPGREGEWKRYDYDAFTNIGHLREQSRKVEENTSRYLAKLTPSELERIVQFKRRDGTILNLRVEDALIQSVTEQLYHLGEIITLLWQLNVEPPPMQWFIYAKK